MLVERAFAKRRQQVESGELSQKRSEIDEITEVRTCEVERNLIAQKEKLCSVEVGEALLDGRISQAQAKAARQVQERAGC